MPDWVAHVLVAWTICTVLRFKYKQFDTPNTVIAMIGSLIPDLFKISILMQYLGIYTWDFISPVHLPVGSIIISAIIALFFKDRKIIFYFLLLGVFTHYLMDALLVNLNGGMSLFFPISWEKIEYGIIPSDDYIITIIAIILAFIVYLISLRKNNKVNFKGL